MRLSKLSVLNFRGFGKLDLVFEPDVTVLVGVNGAGKTSLLDAIALMLTQLAKGIVSTRNNGTALELSDVRAGEASACVTLAAQFGPEIVDWTLVETLPGHQTQLTNSLEGLKGPIATAQRSIAEGAPHLPLGIYYATNRAALDIPARIRTPHQFDALSAYDGALESGSSNFRGFFEWFRQEEDIYNEQFVMNELPAGQKSKLPIVRRAIETLFPGSSELRVERRPQKMTLLYRSVRLDVSQLSDGEKCLLAMVGDLARRMVLAFPGAADPLSEEAVVLIDEIELHLHPGLQRTILPRLREAFPNTQFVVSTHSPQVLSSVHAQNVRLLEDFRVRELDRGTWQRDTNCILEGAFGDPGRPPEIANKLNRLREAIDNGQLSDARALLAELRALIEGDDPEVFFLEQQLPEDSAETRQ